MKLRNILLTASLPAAAACATTGAAGTAPGDGESLIRAMHGRYAGGGYRTLVFTQKTTFSAPGGPVRVETWEEYRAVPGRWREARRS